MKLNIPKGIIFYLPLLLYILVGTILFLSQRKFLYFPAEKIPHGFEQERISNEGETIEVIVLNRGEDKALLYFGGNAESVVYNADDFLQLFPNYTVYLFSYRGYGGSSGQPTEQGIYSDALALFDKVKQKHSQISIIGRSLGTGVATYLASIRPVAKMVLVSPYDSIQRMAQKRFPIYPMPLLLKDKYDSIGRVKNIEAKTLVIIAENDQIIPNKYSQNLVSKFPSEQITVKTIPGVGHNDISSKREYYDYLQYFLDD